LWDRFFFSDALAEICGSFAVAALREELGFVDEGDILGDFAAGPTCVQVEESGDGSGEAQNRAEFRRVFGASIVISLK